MSSKIQQIYLFKGAFECEFQIIHEMMQQRVQEDVWVDDAVDVAKIDRSIRQNFLRFHVFGKQRNLKARNNSR